MDKEDILTTEANYIREALRFLDVDVEGLEVAKDDNLNVIFWQSPKIVEGMNIAGSYPIRDRRTTMLSVISAIAMMQHKYQALIYDAIQMADMFALPDPKRNSLLELSLRAAIGFAMDHMPYSVVMAHIRKTFHFEENLAEMKEAHQKAKLFEYARQKKNGERDD